MAQLVEWQMICRSEGTWIEPILVFLALTLPNSPNSIWRKFTAVVENAAPGRAPRGVARPDTARYGTQPPPRPALLLSWRNTRSILLRPILFCIFGMCSPRRKSAATVRTMRYCNASHIQYIHIICRWSTVMSAKIFTMLDSEAEAQGAFTEPLLAKQVRGFYFSMSPFAVKLRPTPK